MIEAPFKIPFEEIDSEAAGRCIDIITALTPIDAGILCKGGVRGNDHTCPLCGRGSFFVDDDVDYHGRVNCRRCDIKTGGVCDTVAKFSNCDHSEARQRIAEYLGINGTGKSTRAIAKVDIVEAVARAKQMPVDAFLSFGAKKATRNGKPVARVPVYNEAGEIHSHFDITPTDKGLFRQGEGSSGMFFPGRLPEKGETWLGVEGVKDASALTGMGYLAFGLPMSEMNAKYAKLFRGVHVVMVPDLDLPGQNGAKKTCSRLVDIAASVQIARLPGEIKESKGDDVRDVLRRDGGEADIRDAIENANEWTLDRQLKFATNDEAVPAAAKESMSMSPELFNCELTLIDGDPVSFRFRCLSVSDKYCELSEWAPTLPSIKREFLKQTHRPLPMAVQREWKTLPDLLADPRFMKIERPEASENYICVIAAAITKYERGWSRYDSLSDIEWAVIDTQSVVRVGADMYLHAENLFTTLTAGKMFELTRKRLTRVLRLAGADSKITNLGRGDSATRIRLWKLTPEMLERLRSISEGEY